MLPPILQPVPSGIRPDPLRPDPLRPDPTPSDAVVPRSVPSRVVTATGSLTSRVANGVSTVALDRPGVDHPFTVHHPLYAALRCDWRSVRRWLGRDDPGTG
jgi:hypothetical protein